MPDISIQFHATPDEISGWLREWIERDDLHLVAIKFAPFEAKEVELSKVNSVVYDESVRRLSLLVRQPDVTPKNQTDYADRHSDQLVLDVGQCTHEGLRESWMACRTDNVEAYKVWKRLAKELTARTKAGVTATDIKTGESAFYKSYRYTDGAKALENRGVKMLPMKGLSGLRLQLGNCHTR
jgi:hypothetical protein